MIEKDLDNYLKLFGNKIIGIVSIKTKTHSCKNKKICVVDISYLIAIKCNIYNIMYDVICNYYLY